MNARALLTPDTRFALRPGPVREFSLADVARVMSVPYVTVRKWVANGWLRTRRRGGKVYVRQRSLTTAMGRPEVQADRWNAGRRETER